MIVMTIKGARCISLACCIFVKVGAALYPLLIVREELVCLVILLFLLLNAHFYKMGKDSGNFLRLASLAVGHVVFDIITVITVNHREAVPLWLNNVLHVIFYFFAILFAYQFFCYCVEISLPGANVRRICLMGLLPPAVGLIALPFLSIDYLTGNGTDYSFGPVVFVGYGIAMFYFICSLALVLCRHKHIQPHVKFALYPMLLALMAAVLIQIRVPELLFTGGAVTIVTVGFFFSLENPAAVFRQKVQTDALTGVQSRHSYEEDIVRIEREYAAGVRGYCAIFCDINHLRDVNNRYGHLEGDTYISNVALILQQEIRHATGIYRMGGDEFLVICKNCTEDALVRDIASVSRRCEDLSRRKGYPTEVAMGYALSGEEYPRFKDVIEAADYRMYRNKAAARMRRLEEAGKEEVSGENFGAFAASGDRGCPFVCNLDANITLLNRSWVEEFDLPGEVIHDFPRCWAERVHPDDLEEYHRVSRLIVGGKVRECDILYRVRNKRGEYVRCACRGSVYPGRDGGPDLFVGVLVNYGVAEGKEEDGASKGATG